MLIFKKSDESNAYKEFQPDPEFRRVVFSDTEYVQHKNHKEIHHEDNTTKLGKLIYNFTVPVNGIFRGSEYSQNSWKIY
ncbi:hypothetical protein J6590_010004 [Homalodisca vitripennis]|nr:hypothetical protein J6590_010004 [Homalodisca vitripennis]